MAFAKYLAHCNVNLTFACTRCIIKETHLSSYNEMKMQVNLCGSYSVGLVGGMCGVSY